MDGPVTGSHDVVEDERFPAYNREQLIPTNEGAYIEIAEADRCNVMWELLMKQPNANEAKADDWHITDDVAQWLQECDHYVERTGQPITSGRVIDLTKISPAMHFEIKSSARMNMFSIRVLVKTHRPYPTVGFEGGCLTVDEQWPSVAYRGLGRVGPMVMTSTGYYDNRQVIVRSRRDFSISGRESHAASQPANPVDAPVETPVATPPASPTFTSVTARSRDDQSVHVTSPPEQDNAAPSDQDQMVPPTPTPPVTRLDVPEKGKGNPTPTSKGNIPVAKGDCGKPDGGKPGCGKSDGGKPDNVQGGKTDSKGTKQGDKGSSKGKQNAPATSSPTPTGTVIVPAASGHGATWPMNRTPSRGVRSHIDDVFTFTKVGNVLYKVHDDGERLIKVLKENLSDFELQVLKECEDATQAVNAPPSPANSTVDNSDPPSGPKVHNEGDRIWYYQNAKEMWEKTRRIHDCPATANYPSPYRHWTEHSKRPIFVEHCLDVENDFDISIFRDDYRFFDSLIDINKKPFANRNQYLEHFTLGRSVNFRGLPHSRYEAYERQIEVWIRNQNRTFSVVFDTYDNKGCIHTRLVSLDPEPVTEPLSYQELSDVNEIQTFLHLMCSKDLRFSFSQKEFLSRENQVVNQAKAIPPKMQFKARLDLIVQRYPPYIKWAVTNVGLNDNGSVYWHKKREEDAFPESYYSDKERRTKRTPEEMAAISSRVGIYEYAKVANRWSYDQNSASVQEDTRIVAEMKKHCELYWKDDGSMRSHH